MSHFYANMEGARGEVTRCGNKHTGMVVHARGWEVGCRVQLVHENGKDIVQVYKTGGTNDPTPTLLLAFTKEGML